MYVHAFRWVDRSVRELNQVEFFTHTATHSLCNQNKKDQDGRQAGKQASLSRRLLLRLRFVVDQTFVHTSAVDLGGMFYICIILYFAMNGGG